MKHVIAASVAIIVLCGFGSCSTMPVLPARAAIPVECKEPKPQRPAMPTDVLPRTACDGDALCLDRATQAYQAELAVRDGYEDQLVTALDACTKPIKP